MILINQFHDVDYSLQDLSGQSFSKVLFTDCNFQGAILTETEFDDCDFVGCNFTNPVLGKTKLVKVRFRQSRIMGVHFGDCLTFAFDVSFDACSLRQCNFSFLKMKKTQFLKCEIVSCDFNETFLPESSFEGSTFHDTFFHGASLEKADFRNARGYLLDPRSNNIKKARFSTPEVLNLLSNFDIIVEE